VGARTACAYDECGSDRCLLEGKLEPFEHCDSR
jgi:hypothetical protein